MILTKRLLLKQHILSNLQKSISIKSQQIQLFQIQKYITKQGGGVLTRNFSSVPPNNGDTKSKTNFINEMASSDIAPDIQEKIDKLEKSQPFFDRLMQFDPDVMATLPYWLEVFDPVVEKTKDFFVYIHQVTGAPWWLVIASVCCIARFSIMPLIFLQMKRFSKLGQIAPVLLQIKKLVDRSTLPKKSKYFLFGKIIYKVVKNQELKTFRLFVYNLFHFPMLITVIWSIRRLLTEDSIKNTPFLWIDSFISIDPYYVIPFVTIALYYWNFQRFITKQNKDTLPSRIRNYAQMFLILWFPLLCNWPVTTVLTSPKYIRYVDPKMILYQFFVRFSEYDNKQSKALIEGIQTGEESFHDRAITEEELVEQLQDMLKNLEKEQKNLDKK